MAVPNCSSGLEVEVLAFVVEIDSVRFLSERDYRVALVTSKVSKKTVDARSLLLKKDQNKVEVRA
jgi:hypothetical protein